MRKRCEHCPMTDDSLVQRFCEGRCDVDGNFGFDVMHRLHQLGIDLYRAELYEDARNAFRAACEHSSSFAVESSFNLALCYVRLESYQAALDEVEKVLKEYNGSDAHWLKGRILQYMKRWDEAEQSIKEAVDLGSDRATEALTNLPLERLRDQMEKTGIAEDPERKLALLKSFSGKSRRLEIGQRSKLLIEAAQAAVELGDYAQARDLLTRAYRQDTTAETTFCLAEFLMDHGEESESEIAESLLRRVLSLDRNHGRARFCLGRLYRARGQSDLAITSFVSALRIAPSDEITFETAEAAAETGNVPYCLALLQRIESASDPDAYWVERARQLRRSIQA